MIASGLFAPPPVLSRGAAARNVLVLSLAQAWRVGLGILSAVVMSRLLPPGEFGLMALAMPILVFMGMVQDLGLNQAMVQRLEISHAQASAMFWIAALLGVALSACLAMSAPAIAWFFGQPDLKPLLLACAVLPALGGLYSQHAAIMTRRMRFTRLAAIESGAATAGFAAAAVIAHLSPSYWALYLSALTSSTVSLVGVWASCRWLPGRPGPAPGLGEIVRFGGGVSGANFLNYIHRNADSFIIAKTLGTLQLGLYDRAYKLLLFPIQQVHAPVGRLMMPLLSAKQGDRDAYREAFLECSTLVMGVTQPAVLVATFCAHDLVQLLLGPGWHDVGDIFRWLGICALQQVYTSTFGWLLVTQGRGADAVKLAAFGCVTSVGSFACGLPWGVTGVAAAYALVDIAVRVPVVAWVVGSKGPLGVRDLACCAGPHVLSLGICACLLLAGGVRDGGLTAAGLAAWGMAIQAAYLAVVSLFPAKRAHLLGAARMLLPLAWRLRARPA